MVLFAWDNTHHVEVGMVLGRPVHVRLIFLLLTTFLIGHFTAVLLNVFLSQRIKAKGGQGRERRAEYGDEDDDLF